MADILVTFFHILFHRLAGLSSVNLTTCLGDGVRVMESTLPGCPLQGSILALSVLCVWGLCFSLGLLSLN